MSDEPLPAKLQEFLARHIDSIAQLEALLLLRATPDMIWDAPSTARRLYISEQEALETLAHLADRGLLTRRSADYRFAPQSEEILEMVGQLAEY